MPPRAGAVATRDRDPDEAGLATPTLVVSARMRRAAFVSLLVAGLTAAALARAQDTDLDKDDATKLPDASFKPYTPTAIATIKAHAYTLQECLALADRNHPS